MMKPAHTRTRGIVFGTAVAAALLLPLGCAGPANPMRLGDGPAEATKNWQTVADAPGVLETGPGGRAGIRFPRPWSGGGFIAEGPLAVIVDYRDTLKTPTTLHLRPFHTNAEQYVGHFAGLGDGRWKRAVFAIDPELMDSDRDGMCFAAIGQPGAVAKGRPTTQLASPGLAVRSFRCVPLTATLRAQACQRRWASYERLLTTMTAGMAPSSQPATAPTDVPARFSDAGFIPFSQPDDRRLSMLAPPARDEWGVQAIRLRLARGQSGSVSVGVYPLRDGRLTASARMESPAGGPIRLDLGRSLSGPLQDWELDPATKKWHRTQKYTLVEQWLLPVEGPIDLRAGHAHRLRVRVSVPPNTPPGVYRGRLTLATAGGELSIAIELTVVPVTLDTFARHDRFAGVFTASPSKRAELADLADHRLNSHMIFYDAFKFDMRNQAGRMVTDWTRWNWWVRQLKSAGLTGPLVIVLGNDSSGFYERHIGEVFGLAGLNRENHYIDVSNARLNELYIEGLRQLMANARANGWPEVVLLPYDEPTERLLAQYNDRCRRIHEALPGVRIYGVAMNELAVAQQVVDSCDILAASGDLEPISRLCQASGKRLWVYGHSPAYPGGDMSEVRCEYGLTFWRTGGQARWWWTYHWTDTEPLLMLGDRKPSWVSAAYESLGGPIPTLGYEAVREGFDDVRCMLTLERMIREHPDRRGSQLASELLDQMRSLDYYDVLREPMVQWLADQPDRDRDADLSGLMSPYIESAWLMMRRIESGVPAGAGGMNRLAASAARIDRHRDQRLTLVFTETTGKGSVAVELIDVGIEQPLIAPFVLGPGQTREVVLVNPEHPDQSLLQWNWCSVKCTADKGRLPAAAAPGNMKLTCLVADKPAWAADTSVTPAPLRHCFAMQFTLRRK